MKTAEMMDILMEHLLVEMKDSSLVEKLVDQLEYSWAVWMGIIKVNWTVIESGRVKDNRLVDSKVDSLEY
jgi:hypothetical protein